MDMEYDLNEYFVLLLYVFLWFKYMVRYTTIIDSYYCNYCIHTAIEIAPCMTLVQECNASASHLQLLLRH